MTLPLPPSGALPAQDPTPPDPVLALPASPQPVSTSTTDAMAAIIAPAAGPSLRIRTATISAVDYPSQTVSVLFSGGSTPVIGVCYLDSYLPAVNDIVQVLQDEPAVFVIGEAAKGAKSIMPVGSVSAFAGSTAPAGWLTCDGTAVSRATYAVLYTVIGTTYGGGDGSTTFNLPNLADRVPVGPGSRARGATGGAATYSLTLGQLPSHTHGGSSFTTSSENQQHNHSFTTSGVGDHAHGQYVTAATGGGGGIRTDYTGDAASGAYPQGVNTGYAGAHSHAGDSGYENAQHQHVGTTGTTGATGSGASIDNMSPYLVMPWIIKVI